MGVAKSNSFISVLAIAAGAWAFITTQAVTKDHFEPILAVCTNKDANVEESGYHSYDKRVGLVALDFLVCLITQFMVDLTTVAPAGLLTWGTTMLSAVPASMLMSLEANRSGNKGLLKWPVIVSLLGQLFGISVVFPLLWVPSYVFFASGSSGHVNATLAKILILPVLPFMILTVALFTLDVSTPEWTTCAGILGGPMICFFGILPTLLKPPTITTPQEVMKTARWTGLSFGVGGILSAIGWFYMLYVAFIHYGTDVQALWKDLWAEGHPSIKFMAIDASVLWLGVILYIASRKMSSAMEALMLTPLFGPGAACCMAVVALEMESASTLAKQQSKKTNKMKMSSNVSPMFARRFVVFLVLQRGGCIAEETFKVATAVIDVDTVTTTAVASNQVPDGCTLVMARSSIPNGGWGVFSLRHYNKDALIYSTSDLVIQIPDMTPDAGAKKLVWEYLWDGQETGGQFEGQKVFSFVPGMGMLANGEAKEYYNVLPSLQPSIDGADTQASPGAGAITHYHNFTWFAHREILPGDELFINYGPEWFQERGFPLSLPPTQRQNPSVEDLKQEGYCLDNLRPGLSGIQFAGRGSFASRSLLEGSIVAPVPVLSVSLKSLAMFKLQQNGQWVQTEQLLLNYCYGHSNSSLIVLCPYSNMVNMINHAPNSASNNDGIRSIDKRANVRLQWSKHSQKYLNLQPEALPASSTQLLLELVALRDIIQGEELLLDYGDEWSHAWNEYVDTWEEPDGDDFTIPSHVMNRRWPPVMRTLKEQQTNPYPDNIFTSCYYKFNDEFFQDMKSQDAGKATLREPVQMVDEWKHTRGIYETRNMRPCWILDRRSSIGHNDNETFSYKVRLMNRPGQPENERIPKSVHFIVTNVPREAIQFSDKLYTTDQHLQNAFRYSIRALNDIFPAAWMDVKCSSSE